MDPNYQPPAYLDVSNLTIRQLSPRLNPNYNDNDSDPGGHQHKLHGVLATPEKLTMMTVIMKLGFQTIQI